MKLFFGVILSFIGAGLLFANGLFGYYMYTEPESWIVNTVNTTDILDITINTTERYIQILFDVDPEMEFDCIDYQKYCDSLDCVNFFKTLESGNSYIVIGRSAIKRGKYCDYCFQGETDCDKYYDYRMYVSVIVYVVCSIVTIVISATLFILANNPKNIKIDRVIDRTRESSDSDYSVPSVVIRPKRRPRTAKVLPITDKPDSNTTIDSNETVVGNH
jgi:hypothetical protein